MSKFFQSLKLFLFLGSRIWNPESGSGSALRWNPGSGSALRLMRIRNTGLGTLVLRLWTVKCVDRTVFGQYNSKDPDSISAPQMRIRIYNYGYGRRALCVMNSKIILLVSVSDPKRFFVYGSGSEFTGNSGSGSYFSRNSGSDSGSGSKSNFFTKFNENWSV